MNATLSCNLIIYDLNDQPPVFTYPEEGKDIWINEVKFIFNGSFMMLIITHEDTFTDNTCSLINTKTFWYLERSNTRKVKHKKAQTQESSNT